MTTSEAAEAPPIIDRTAWLTLAMTAVVGFMVSLEITVISLALPEIRASFDDAAESTISWIITAYNIGLASLLLVAGWAADRYGRRRVFTTGLIVFAVGSLLAGLAPSIETLIAARILQSIGGAMQFPSGLALLLTAFPPQRRQMAIGVWGAMGGLAAAVGPPIGGFLVGLFGWPSVFLINVPVAALAAVGTVLWIHESRGDVPDGRVDLISIPLGTIGVGAIVAAIVRAEEWGWTSTAALTTFAVAVVLILAFVFRSRRHPRPLFDLDLFAIPSFSLGNVGSIFFVVAFFAYFVPLPTYIQEVWGWSAVRTGLVLVPGPLLAALTSPPVGRLADRIGTAPILTVGGLSGLLAMIIHRITTSTDPEPFLGVILPGLFVGIAAGCSFAMLVGATMRDIPPARFAMAGAGRTTVFQLAIALAIAVGVAIVGRPDGPADHLAALRQVWLVCAVLFAGQVVIFGLLFPRIAAQSTAPTIATRPSAGD
ncbi:MAG: DHA2 family efflux MFS transporter permease subunit [Actinomycetota bacterium]